MRFVPPATIAGAFLVSQLTLLLLLIPRFWQRGVAVAYHQRYMVEPILVQSFTPGPVVVPGVTEPEPAPVGLSGPPETQAS